MVDTIGKMDHLARVIVGNIKEKNTIMVAYDT